MMEAKGETVGPNSNDYHTKLEGSKSRDLTQDLGGSGHKVKRQFKQKLAHQAERRQLSSVITYGMPENFSVDLLTIILLNVILYKIQLVTNFNQNFN